MMYSVEEEQGRRLADCGSLNGGESCTYSYECSAKCCIIGSCTSTTSTSPACEGNTACPSESLAGGIIFLICCCSCCCLLLSPCWLPCLAGLLFLIFFVLFLAIGGGFVLCCTLLCCMALCGLTY